MSNYSLFAVPAYFLSSLIPHAYAQQIIKAANNGVFDNSSPRSLVWDEKIRKSTPAAIYSRYERAEAASKNGFENLPLFVGAILAGNMAKLDSTTMNGFVVAYMVSRLAYNIIYIEVSKTHQLSQLRSLAWMAGAIMCLGVYIRAGLAMV
jgi:uncharacterized MAPEG superfamily protein